MARLRPKPIAGDYFGKAEVLEFFAKMMDLYQGTLRLQILDVMAMISMAPS
jgi:hypothetical protein